MTMTDNCGYRISRYSSCSIIRVESYITQNCETRYMQAGPSKLMQGQIETNKMQNLHLDVHSCCQSTLFFGYSQLPLILFASKYSR